MADVTDALDRYAAQRLILSWREVPGRGIVVIGADMGEYELRTPHAAALFLGALASAAQAIHDGTVRDA